MPTNQEKIVVYTDGSNSLKTGYCGWAVIAFWKDNVTKACGWGKGSNAYSELYAIIYALRKLPKQVPVTIVSDSEYAINSLTLHRAKWEKNGYINSYGLEVKFKDLIIEGHKLCDLFSDITFHHVKSHTGVTGNELADRLAKSARLLAEGKLENIELDAVIAMENGIEI